MLQMISYRAPTFYDTYLNWIRTHDSGDCVFFCLTACLCVTLIIMNVVLGYRRVYGTDAFEGVLQILPHREAKSGHLPTNHLRPGWNCTGRSARSMCTKCCSGNVDHTFMAFNPRIWNKCADGLKSLSLFLFGFLSTSKSIMNNVPLDKRWHEGRNWFC